MRHKDQPRISEIPDDLQERLDKIKASDYFAYVGQLEKDVRGRLSQALKAAALASSCISRGGSWVASYLDGARLLFRFGTGEIPPDVDAL
jgi:hypothetical protein